MRMLLIMAAAGFFATSDVPKITQTGQGMTTAMPNLAYIVVGITTRDASVAGAVAANSSVMNAVHDALDKQGVTADDVVTVQFTIGENYKDVIVNNQRDGYYVLNKVKVTIRHVTKVGTIVDAIVAAGATDIDSVRLGHTKASDLTDVARTQAVNDATRRATLIANALGYDLDTVVEARETTPVHTRNEIMRLSGGASRGGDSTSIAGGCQEYSVGVEVTWTLKKKVAP